MSETTPPAGGGFDSFSRSHLFRVLSLGLLVLILQIPVGMVDRLIGERQARRDNAAAGITAKWGGRQDLVGPLLVVPYELHTHTRLSDGSDKVTKRIRYASFLAESLVYDAQLASELRERGIFEVPVYESTVRMSGSFARPDFSGFEVPPDVVQWERALLAMYISDARSIQDAPRLRWGDGEIAFEPGPGEGGAAGPGIHAPLAGLKGAGPFDFDFALRLHGSHGLYFAPLARDTEVRVTSDWPHPSFQGAWLPRSREIGAEGFEARWRVPYLGRSYPQSWSEEDAPLEAIAASRFGVDFITPVDPYRVSERAVKYDLLFLGLTFLSLWLFEVLAGARVHAVQYLFVGGGMSLFYLLLLALSEHLGVGWSYALAAAGIIALVSGCAVAVLGQRRRGAAIGAVVTGLYGYLYVLLHNEDHALLVGSLGLFAVLAAVMWLTRRVDWFEKVPLPGPEAADRQSG